MQHKRRVFDRPSHSSPLLSHCSSLLPHNPDTRLPLLCMWTEAGEYSSERMICMLLFIAQYAYNFVVFMIESVNSYNKHKYYYCIYPFQNSDEVTDISLLLAVLHVQTWCAIDP